MTKKKPSGPRVQTCARADAVRRIGGHIADRDAFVISVPPDDVAEMPDALRLVNGWSAYVDNGTDNVLRVRDAARLAGIVIATALCGVPVAAVVTVPKTVSATALSDALGRQVAADGSQDLVIIHGPDDEPITWPRLFVDALATVDRAAAAQIYVNDRANLS